MATQGNQWFLGTRRRVWVALLVGVVVISVAAGVFVWLAKPQRAAHASPSVIREYSTIWAGNIAIGDGYQWASAEWTVPTITNSGPCANPPLYYEDCTVSVWVGLGGAQDEANGPNPGHLIQAGTDSYVDPDSGHSCYRPWWEDDVYKAFYSYVNGADCSDTSGAFTVDAGNRVRVYVSSNFGSESAGTVYFRFENLTTARSYSFSGCDPSTSFGTCDSSKPSWLPPSRSGATASTAEWIVELPGNYGGSSNQHANPLNHINPTVDAAIFSAAKTGQNGTSLYVGQTSHNYSVITRDGNSTSQILAEPGWINCDGTSFRVYFGPSPESGCSGGGGGGGGGSSGGGGSDSDGDGILDSSDWCPLVAGNPTNNGCPNDVNQVSGDVNGDGKKDVVAISRGLSNQPDISWFPSTSSATTASVADPLPAGVSLPAPAWNVDYLKWSVGDFNGDGKDDLSVVSGNASNPPNMYLLLSTGSGFMAPQLVKQPNPTYWLWPRLEFLAGDIDGDGKSDIIAISRGLDNAPGISWFRSTSTGTTASLADPAALKALPAPAWNVSNLKWTVGDFNGDHKADLFVMSGSANDPPAMYILQSTGAILADPVLVKQPNPAYWQWPRLTVMAGDLNGDGKSDIIYESRNLDNTAVFGWLQSTSTPTTPSLADGVGLQAPGQYWLAANLKLAVIDVNGDGKADLFACSGSATDPPSLYVFLAGASGTLNNPTLIYQPNPTYWLWPRLQF